MKWDYINQLAGQLPYNAERTEEYEAHIKKLYYKSLKRISRHGKPVRLKHNNLIINN